MDASSDNVPLPRDDAEADPVILPTANLDALFGQLADDTRRLLPAVCLFQNVADIRILAAFAHSPGCPARFAGTEPPDWAAALEDASRAGLLTGLGSGMWRVDFAVSADLADLWRAENPADHEGVRDAATRCFAIACAGLGASLDQLLAAGNDALAYQVAGAHRGTLSTMLDYTLGHQMWEEARAIAGPLNQYLDSRELAGEADTWAARIQTATENPDGTPLNLDSPAGSLWLFITAQRASRQRESGNLDHAERSYQRILAMLEAQPESDETLTNISLAASHLGVIAIMDGRPDEAKGWYRKSLAIDENLGDRPAAAICYHQLGSIAWSEGELDEAEGWCRRAIVIREQLGLRALLATDYHEMGIIASLQKQLDDAEDWYNQALAISEDLGDQPNMALSYHQLGMLAHARQQLDEAENWYNQALAIFEELGDRQRMALSYHQLGMLAHARERLDDAEIWYMLALDISHQFEDRPHIAAGYHQLGLLARDRGQLDEAETWYGESLAIDKDLGNRPGIATGYCQLGLLAEQRGQARQALEWMVRSVTMFDQFPNPSTEPAPQHLARLTTQLGTTTLEQHWLAITGSPLPEAVHDYIGEHESD